MPEIRFTATTYEECSRELLAFRNANRDTKRDESYFNWRYLKRSNGLHSIIVWAEDEKGMKIGSLSLIPHHYLINKADYPLGVLGDISVAKEWRGKGIAKQMFNYLAGLDEVKKLKACVVLPNEIAARALEKSGWMKVSRLERYVKVLSGERLLEKWLKNTTLAKLISLPVNFLLWALSYERFLKKPDGLRVEIIERFDDRFDRLWKDLKKDGFIIGLRNKDYLAWRYSAHPVVKYRIFTITHGERLCGYAVFHYNDGICQVDDILCLNQNRYPAHLLSCFLDHIRKNTASSSVAINMNLNDMSNLPLRRFGFIRRPDYQNLMVSRNSFEDLRFFLNGRRWFLTQGDKDA